MNLNIIVVWCCVQAVSYPVLVACVNCRRYKVKGVKKKKPFIFFSKVKIIIIFFIEPVYLIKGQKSSLSQFGNQERKPAFFSLSRFASKFRRLMESKIIRRVGTLHHGYCMQ